MKKDHQESLSHSTPTARLSVLAVAATLLASGPASGIEFESGELSGNFDTTISAGVAWRVQDRSPGLVGIANGGTQYSVNYDNGNLNYDKGVYSSVLKATHDLELKYRNFGAFVRAFYFYDFENKKDDRERTPLGDEAMELVGSDARILDAYVSGDFNAGSKPLTLRFGKQVVSWGESTFIPNGVNAINPVDVSRLRTPGAELREAFLPVNMVWGSLGVSDQVSVEAFYQLDWEAIKIDPAGGYFSSNDFASPDGKYIYLGSGSVPDSLPPGTGIGGPTGVVVPRGADRVPGNGGQYGLALRWFAPRFNNTEFGFYHLNYHSRLPLISATTGTPAGAMGGDYAATARYFVEYPEDIKLYGVSFNTGLGNTGISLQGEVSHRPNVPLQVDDAELLFAALTPLSPALGMFTQLGTFGFGTDIQGYRRMDVTQAQVTATKVFGPTLGADQVIFLTEVGMTKVHDMPSRSELRFDGPGTFTSGNPIAAPAGLQPVHQSSGFADDFSMGYRLLARFDYNNAIGAFNLSPRVAFAHDVAGTTPLPLGNFIQDRKALSIGIAASYQNTWSADLSYTRYFGAEAFNLIHDRDFIALNIKWSK